MKPIALQSNPFIAVHFVMILLSLRRCNIIVYPHESYVNFHRQLDVYYPSSLAARPPILVFFYGGGFTRGARSNPPLMLVHNNLGAFFASKGIITVVADYHLVPGAVYPQGSQDVHNAITWVIEHLSTEGDSKRLFVMGHSAGGIHVSGLLLSPSMFSSVANAVRGVVLVGVPCEIQNRKAEFRSAAELYYGSAKQLALHQPLGLLRRSDPDYIATLPVVLNIIAKSEPRMISSSVRIFTQMLWEKGAKAELYVLEGHDHVSPILALSSGHGEEWGNQIVDWILTH